jgi:hypothetical protein
VENTKKENDEAMNKAIELIANKNSYSNKNGYWNIIQNDTFFLISILKVYEKIDFRKGLYILHLEYSILFNLLFISDLIAKFKNGVRLLEMIIFKQLNF